jgi:hypothetical protein
LAPTAALGPEAAKQLPRLSLANFTRSAADTFIKPPVVFSSEFINETNPT